MRLKGHTLFEKPQVLDISIENLKDKKNLQTEKTKNNKCNFF